MITANDDPRDELVCLECNAPLDEIEYGQLVCPKCGEDYMGLGHYYECRAEMYYDGTRWQLTLWEAPADPD